MVEQIATLYERNTMTVFTCAPDLDAILTCIYTAWNSGLGHNNIRLETEPTEQYEMFTEYIHVDPDSEKAVKVMNTIKDRISPALYFNLAYCSMSCEKDVADNIYRVIILGFMFGKNVMEHTEYRDIFRNIEIRKKVGSEACHFKEFVRFHQTKGNIYVAHIEPKSRIIPALGLDFSDRMPSENWMIVDDTHKEAAVHYKDESYYIQKLTDDEYIKLLQTEKENDEYTDLWKLFYDTIAIKERANEKCRQNLFPLWKRKHAVEFM